MKLTIKRSKWLRGEGTDKSYLLRHSDGKMCCLGFYSLALGKTEEDIADVPVPNDLPISAFPEEGRWLLTRTTHPGGAVSVDASADCVALMRTNDFVTVSETDREPEIAAVFAKHGVEVVFVD